MYSVWWYSIRGMQSLLFAVLLAILQTISPLPGNPPHRASGVSSGVKRDATANQAPANRWQSGSKILASQTQNPGNSPQTEEQAQSVRVRELPPVSVTRDWADWVLWVFNGLFITAGIAGIRLAYGTLKAVERQTKATEDAANAAGRSVDIIISKERARIQIEMKGDPMICGPEDPIPINEVKYIVRCHGTTPAHILDTHAWAVISDSDISSDHLLIDEFYPAMIIPSIVTPTNEGVETAASLVGDALTHGIDIADLVRKGDLLVHFYGSIKYRDVFGGTWIYEFKHRWCVGPYVGGQWRGRGEEKRADESDRPDSLQPN